MPFFSIVIPLFNKEKYIKETLRSVLNQSFTDFEIIVINDGSTDNSLNMVNFFTDKRISIIDQENKGLCASRNVGIKKANGKFIAFLDADDLWMEDYLETINKLITLNKDHKIFATNVKLLQPNKSPNLLTNSFNIKLKTIITNYFKLCKNIMGPSSLVVSKSVFEIVGFFNEAINYGEEDDFYIRCFSKFDLIYYQKPKTYYRTGIQNQLTAPNSDFKRKIPDYEVYLKVNKGEDLKKFIDFVHYRLVVIFKMERNHKLVKFYKAKINASNLTTIQKIKYYLPTNLFYVTKRIYLWFSNRLTQF
jgi:glycosyltransferase involved in cell wall biosynthesis